MGTLSFLPNGLVVYTPYPGASGPDQFQYRICDVHPVNPAPGCVNVPVLCSIATVSVNIQNRAPVPNDDVFTTIPERIIHQYGGLQRSGA